MLVTLAIALGISGPPEPFLPNTIDCKFDTTTHVERGDGGTALAWTHTTKKDKSPFVITFSELNGDKPVLVGNAGSSSLTKMAGNGVLYFVEQTGSGNVVLYTYFPRSRTMVYSKQYDFGFGLEKRDGRPDAPLVMLSSGSCQAR